MAEPEPRTEGRPSLTLPRSALFASAGLMLAVGVLGYAIGYEVGGRAMESELLGSAPEMEIPGDRAPAGGATLGQGSGRGGGPGVERVVDPLVPGADQGAGSEESASGRGDDRAGLPGGESAAPPSPASGGRVYESDAGWVSDDPRTPGTNYLALATLDREDAVEAVDVLERGGVDSVAVRVEGGATAANDSDRFVVYSLGLAVPSGRYSAMADQRRVHERRVGEIGRRWAERGGASAFDQPFWRRYDG